MDKDLKAEEKELTDDINSLAKKVCLIKLPAFRTLRSQSTHRVNT